MMVRDNGEGVEGQRKTERGTEREREREIR